MTVGGAHRGAESDEPRKSKPGQELLSLRAFVIILAGGACAALAITNPPAGIALGAFVTVVAFLHLMVGH